MVEKHTNPVNICSRRIWKVIINDTVNAFEIHTTSNNISCNQNPSFPGSEVIHSIFSLYLSKINWHKLNMRVKKLGGIKIMIYINRQLSRETNLSLCHSILTNMIINNIDIILMKIVK